MRGCWERPVAKGQWPAFQAGSENLEPVARGLGGSASVWLCQGRLLVEQRWHRCPWAPSEWLRPPSDPPSHAAPPPDPGRGWLQADGGWGGPSESRLLLLASGKQGGPKCATGTVVGWGGVGVGARLAEGNHHLQSSSRTEPVIRGCGGRLRRR